ncbi:MAG: hypothetical protein IJB96_05500 [Lachnospira sp.]|nr:hypothetical protein [Lachnospira sp.]
MPEEKSALELELEEKQRWLFKENLRLQELNVKLEKERKIVEDERKLIEIQKGMLERQQSKNQLLSKQLQNQKNLFDSQWQLLEKETRQLAIDKERFERDKLVYKDSVYREARRGISYEGNTKLFFKGVDDSVSLRKRYKELMKIFHPDNTHGDTELIKAIGEEYEKQKRYYLGS